MCDSTDNHYSSITFFTLSLPQTMPNEWRGVGDQENGYLSSACPRLYGSSSDGKS